MYKYSFSTAMGLRHYSTINDMKILLDKEIEGDKRELPENNFLENTLKIEIAVQFSVTQLKVYGYPEVDPQYLFFVEFGGSQYPYIHVRIPLSGHHHTTLNKAVSLVLEQTRTELDKYGKLIINADEETCDTKESEAPTGFTLETVDVDRDGETIHRLWKNSMDLEITINRLRCLPSVCARNSDGQIVGWMMAARFGQLTNLYTMPSYRNRGLGRAMEVAVAKEFARRGLRVFKYVEPENASVYASSLSSDMWTLWTIKDTNSNETTPNLHIFRRYERVAGN